MFTKILRAACAAALGAALAAGAQAQDKVKIGVLLALSGPASFLGEPEEKSFKLLADQKNAQGGVAGRKIEYVIYDTEGNGTKAVQQFRRLVDSDKVDVVLGPNTTAEALLIKPLATELQVPQLSFSGGEEVTVPPSPWVFQPVPNNRIVARHILGYMQKQGLKRVALLTATDAFGQGGANTVKQLLSSFGMTLAAAEEFGTRDTDMTPQILKIKTANPDALIVWSVNPGPSIVMRNAKAVGFDKPVFNSNGVASPQFIEQTAGAAEGSYVSSTRLVAPGSLPASDPSKVIVTKLAADYKARWGKEPATFATIPYDALLILETALKNVQGPVSRKAMRDALQNVTLTGGHGAYRFSPDNHMGLDDKSQAMVMLRIVNGKFTLAP